MRLTPPSLCVTPPTHLLMLQAAACLHGASQGQHIQHIQSTTIPPNTAALRVFSRLGFTHSRTVERWPQEPLQSGYEAAVGFVPNTQQPDLPVQFAPSQPHMLDHIPGEDTCAGIWGRCVGCFSFFLEGGAFGGWGMRSLQQQHLTTYIPS